jgi:hypothetical protein
MRGAKHSITKGMRVRQAVETLFEGFRDSNRVETAWARRLMIREQLSDEEIRAEIVVAQERFCPAVPQEYVSFIVDLLSAAIRLARRDAERDMGYVTENRFITSLPVWDPLHLTAK